MYKGYTELELSEQELADFYIGLYEFPKFLVNNEYILIKNTNGEIVDKVKWLGDGYSKVRYPLITDGNNTMRGRNEYQNCAIDLLLDRNIPVKLLTGRGGAGKDALMSAAAMSLINKGKFKKIVYIRPNVAMEGVPDIGYRKGDTYQKLAWTLGPLVDKYGGQQSIDMLVKKEVIELVPLMEIRGRSFEESIMYISEGQNLTENVMKSIITRVGEKTELWINGDIAQIDRDIYREKNGLEALAAKLKGNKLFGCMYLPIIERSEVAKLGELFDEENEA